MQIEGNNNPPYERSWYPCEEGQSLQGAHHSEVRTAGDSREQL